MSYEYKCVGAPERPKRQRGVRGRSERVALAMQEIISAEAVDGWEYMRTDLVPVEEKNSFFSRAHEVHRAVLVFRRDLQPATRPEPRRVGMAAEAEPGRPAEARMRLSADRDEPAPGRPAEDRVKLAKPDGAEPRREEPQAPVRTARPPTGLG